MFDVETGHLMSPMSAILPYKDIGASYAVNNRARSLSLLPVEGHRPRSVDGLEAEVHVRDARGERDEQRVVRGGPQQHRQRPPNQVRFGTPQAGRAALVAQGE